MKKIVPDPPHSVNPLKIIATPYFSIHSEMIPPDALAYASELIRGLEETLDEYCRSHAGESGKYMLGNAMDSVEMAQALIEHSLSRL
ncbi:hypothetical protein G7009_14620 [Pseudomonas capeferrum]|uniref:hypothetical protein n=1 Tax=Pseudomonas capeferrum TaxID=1495066 RepID=UPI0015E31247|nr:hypothetical protein [Pseudomonas capeferrum]MBA1202975.1 hypothetical protein [Pseudomonas capeferrum]